MLKNSFAGLLGQEKAVETLQKLLLSGRLPHGMVFCGPRGVGKATAARMFASLLLKTTPTKLPVTTSFLHIQPETVFGIDIVREKVLPFFSLRRDGWRVAVLDEAERLTREASNALLKTLEEPPPRSVIILITSRPGELLPTILSRCATVPFSRLTDDQTREVLSRLGVAEEKIKEASRLAAGSPGFALYLIDEGLLDDFGAAVESLISGSSPVAPILNLLRKGKRREVMVELIDALLGVVARRGGASVWNTLRRLQDLQRDVETNLNVNLAVSTIFGEQP